MANVFHLTRPLRYLAWASLFLSGLAIAQDEARIAREGWTFDRSQLEWDGADEQGAKKAGSLKGCLGWAEYDFTTAHAGWYELWVGDYPAEWMHDVFVDNKAILLLSNSNGKLDADPQKKGWWKDANIFLEKGPHKLRFRRLSYPGGLPQKWELRPSGNNASGCIRLVESGEHCLRLGDSVPLKIAGGTGVATSYELLAREEGTTNDHPLGRIEFPISDRPIERTISIQFPKEGIFNVIARTGSGVLRPADFKITEFAVVDTKNAPAPGKALETTNVIDIDCTAEPPKEGFWEKDGATTVKDWSGGRYRESSGRGASEHWSTDGFSYRIDLPDADHLYRLRVDYPDNDRRSMGFWINDGANVSAAHLGVVNGGGVETGDHYALTNKTLTYESFFFPRKNKGLIVAVINLVPGMKAAAARIRIDRVDGPLPAAPLGETRDRAMGFYFEEPGRWLRFFGGDSKAGAESLKTLERWGQWNRYIGANLMFPTINVYQNNQYPSRILEGYFNTPLNETRMAALVAEKYGSDFVPEFHISGQKWFDEHVMGIEVNKTKAGDRPVADVRFLTKEAEEMTGRDRDGRVTFGGKPFGYNALHPKVQEMYINVFGELADLLADCDSFKGISSRMMLSWQYQGWNTVQSLNWGYDDWTIAQFSKDTGLAVPGEDGQAGRFRQRYDFLTGPAREQWIQWRCARIFDFHKRLLARIQKAKPSAKLFFTYTRTAPQLLTSPDIRVQLLQAGVDLKLYENEPGFVIMPTAMYGRRYSTPIGDGEVLEALNHPSVKEVARSGARGLSIFSNYYEVNRWLDWSKLGGGTYAAFDACIPSGVNERETYAIGVADSDCSFIATGGNGWIFGSPALMQPFLREYRALPAAAFTRFEKAIDPVAVWEYRDKDGVLWFYAVNRLNTEVQVALTLSAEARKVRPAAGGEDQTLQDGKLSFTLEPFMMRSFRADGGALLAGQVQVPAAYVESLQQEIASAKVFREDLKSRRIVPEMTRQDVDLMIEQLSDAISAYEKGEYWRAHSQLERVAITRASYASGRYLTGVLHRSEPHGVKAFDPAKPAGWAIAWPNTPEKISTVKGISFDSTGHLWLATGGRAVEYSADGRWSRDVTLFAPFTFDRADGFDRGDIREATLYPPVPFGAKILLPLSEGRMVGQRGTEAPVIFDMKSGRSEKLLLANQLNTRGPCTLLATDGGERILVSVGDGVSEYKSDGTWSRQISKDEARAAAVARDGTIYLAGKDAIKTLSSDGSEVSHLTEPGVEFLAVSPDNARLVAVKGSRLTVFATKGGLAPEWTQELKTNGLAFSPTGTLLIAQGSKDSQPPTIREYSLSTSGLKEVRDWLKAEPAVTIPPLDRTSQLKEYGGNLYWLAGGKLIRLRPGKADQTEVAFDPSLKDKSAAFGFAANGDLYLASSTGEIYRARQSGTSWNAAETLGRPLSTGGPITDLAITHTGEIIIRGAGAKTAATGNVTLVRWSPGHNPEPLIDLGKSTVSPGEYGLAQTTEGDLLVAGGNLRGIWRLSPDGKIIWEKKRQKTAAPGYDDLRSPMAITSDTTGTIWVADPTRHQIMSFGGDGRWLGTLGSFGDDDPKDYLTLNQPSGLATIKDATGREWLYVAEAGRNRIVKWPLPSSR